MDLQADLKLVRKSIADAQKAAAKFGGVCLAKELPNATTPVEWRCTKGHVWKARYNSVRDGHWCPVCRLKMLSIDDLQKTAAKRGGKCLSHKYVNSSTKYQWQCEKGHVWEATAGSVRHGTWCLYCAGQIITIEDAQHLAGAKGGRCLSKRYVNAKTRMRWKCKEGHIWEQTWDKVHRGHWCHHCAKRFSIEAIQKLAASRGGRFISSTYVSARVKYEWECARGHHWHARVDQVKNRGSWCPICRGSNRKSHVATTKIHRLKMRT